ncbi:MAG TPA: hypothetical protein PK095_13145 [Myxococcota bacterium]|nr:hypothetical protein [Myxococcota bacterium]
MWNRKAASASRSLGIIAPMLALGLAASSSGCAITMASLHAATGDWPTSSGHEQRAWIDGSPRKVVTADMHLSTPPRALCSQHVYEPAAKVVREDYGLDGGGRLAIGFIGVSELALGLLPMLLSDDMDTGGAIALGALALDGLATVIMAGAIPDTYKKSEWVEGAKDYHLDTCPPEVVIEVRGHTLPVAPDGTLTPADATFLAESVLSGEPAFHLRNGPDAQRVDVPVEVQCDWARWMHHPAVRRVCPPDRVIVPVPVVPVRPPPVRPPPIR